MATELWSIITVIFVAIYGAFGPIFFKKSSKDFSFNLLKLVKNKYLLLGFFFYGTSSIIFIIALKGGEVSVLYPIISLTNVCVALLSKKFFNEEISINKWIGIALIIAGVSLIGFGK